MFKVLLDILFIDSGERQISREDILERVWDSNNVPPKTIDVHLSGKIFPCVFLGKIFQDIDQFYTM